MRWRAGLLVLVACSSGTESSAPDVDVRGAPSVEALDSIRFATTPQLQDCESAFGLLPAERITVGSFGDVHVLVQAFWSDASGVHRDCSQPFTLVLQQLSGMNLAWSQVESHTGTLQRAGDGFGTGRLEVWVRDSALVASVAVQQAQ